MAIYNESYFNNRYIDSLLENVNITPGQIQKYCTRSIDENYNYLDMILEANGSENILGKLSPILKSNASSAAKDIAKVIKTEGVNSESRKR